MHRIFVSLIPIALSLAPLPSSAAAAPGPVPNEAVVRFAPGVSPAEAAVAADAAGATVIRAMDTPDAYHLRAPDVPATLTALRANPLVRLAHPNNRYALAWRPNDQQLSSQWTLENRGQVVNGDGGVSDADIDALEAWDRSTGSGVVVATIDSGINASHPDLAAAVWTNPGEVGGNGIDDDENGKIDDLHGWDMVGNDADPSDGVGHGTHVAGAIAARAGNGIGIAGTAPSSQIMPVRAVPNDGQATDVMLADAITYAAATGARIINISLSGPEDGGILQSVMREKTGVLFVVAAGNESSDVDSTPSYPCALDVPNMLCVAASTQADIAADFTNYGDGTVEIAAPGDNILTTGFGSGYAYLSGTSMASPVVAGAAAIAWSRYPASVPLDVRQALMDSVDKPSGLSGISISRGRVNAVRAIDALSRLQPFSVVAPLGLSSAAVARFRQAAKNVRPSNVVIRLEGSGPNLAASQTCRAADGGVVPCATGDVSSVTIQPASALTAGQRYQVLLNPSGSAPVTTATGSPMSPQRIAFRASLIEQEWTASGAQGWRNTGSSAAYGGSYAVEHLTGARVHFRFVGDQVTWYTATGPDQGRAQVLIDGQPQAIIDNYAPRRAWRVGHTFGGLVNGTHTITIIVVNSRQVIVDAFRTPNGLYQSPALKYQWRIIQQPGASDGRYVEADYAGAAMSFTFRGTGVHWYPARNPASGKADVYVDGVRRATVDTYATALSLNQPVWIGGLSDAVHTLRIVVLGQRRSAAKGTRVATDKYVVR